MKTPLLTALGWMFCLMISSPPAHAESGITDAFDPFADYSDFIAATTEETDVNFFKYGRQLSVGGLFGVRSFTGNQSELFESNYYFGGFFTYYMSLQFAIKITYTYGTNDMALNYVDGGSPKVLSGASKHLMWSLHGKYFINTQNLTKAIAQFNPFFIGGFSQITREAVTNLTLNYVGGDQTTSFDFGAGLEYLFNNNKNFFTLELMYYLTDFPRENVTIVIQDSRAARSIDTGFKPSGDMLHLSLSVGFNF